MIVIEGWGHMDFIEFTDEDAEIIEAQPIPALPAEVWHRAEADGDERMRAVRALCGG